MKKMEIFILLSSHSSRPPQTNDRLNACLAIELSARNFFQRPLVFFTLLSFSACF